MTTPNNSPKTLGQKLKGLRNHHQLTQESVSEQLFVSRQAISNWEQDKKMPDINNLYKLSKLYDVSLEYLLDDTILNESESANASVTPSTPIQTAHKNEDLRKLIVTAILIFILVISALIPPLGFLMCIATVFISRKFKVNSLLLYIIIVLCFLASAYNMYGVLSYWILDFGYSTVKPL